MPAELQVAGWPVPEQADRVPRKRPDFVPERLERYLDQREEALKKHARLLAQGVNQAGMAAFSPVTTQTSITSGPVTLGVAGVPVAITDLAQTIVAPVPARLQCLLVLRCAYTTAVAGNAAMTGEILVNGTVVGSFRWQVSAGVGATWQQPCFAMSLQDIEPQTSYAVTVQATLITAAAVFTVQEGDEKQCRLQCRVEPRLLV